MADVLTRNNVTVRGNTSGDPMVFAHGFGCDQIMWRHVAPAFEPDHRVVLFDLVGCGGSDASAYDPNSYASLSRYATDLVEIIRELDLSDVIYVGHSVSSMIGALAAIEAPELFRALVLVGPSPRYIDDGTYVGGFGREDIDDLLESLEGNYLGWSQQMAPVIMGNPDQPELGRELTESFCRVDPAIARNFARATFLSDNRDDLPRVPVPALVLQCEHDAIAPIAVGEYVHDNLPNSRYELLPVSGHCPNLSAPELTTDAIRRFVATLAAT